MTPNDYVLTLASLTSWREERGNGLNGCLGVLFVIKNRAKANWELGDVYKILTAANQFDSMTHKGDPNTVLYPNPDDPIFSKLVQYVDGVLDGSIQDTLTQGAVYYADISSPYFNQTGWFAKTILANPTRFPSVAKIGTTSYYADKGA
jgi:hypothetical protein